MNEKIKLLPCPFCGGTAALRELVICGRICATVSCLGCHVRVQPFPAGWDILSEREITPAEAARQAAKLWNSRRPAV